MRIIDVLIKLANGEIKDQTVLEIHNPIGKVYTYTFNGETKMFYNELNWELSYYYQFDDKFLNSDVKLTPPKPKKYLVKFNMRGLKESEMYLNYQTKNDYVFYALPNNQ